jgi:subtilisin family serine protease
VAAVDPDVYVTLDETASDVAEAAMEGSEMNIASPPDPATAVGYPRQWHMRAVRADAAWAAGHLGSPTVRVGILDTGIDYLHPDLYGLVDLALSRSYLRPRRTRASLPGRTRSPT